MKWHRWAAPACSRATRRTVLSIGLLAAPLGGARAELPYDGLESSALAIAAYAASRDLCVYSDKMGKALANIDAFLARNYGSNWESTKQAGPDKLTGLRNTGRALGAQSDCVTYGTAIGYVMPVYFHAADLDQEVLAEFGRLSRGGGRGRSGADEARPQLPAACDPTTTPGKMRAYNRRIGSRQIGPDCPGDETGPTGAASLPNKGSDREFRSTLERLPPDSGPPTAPRSAPISPPPTIAAAPRPVPNAVSSREAAGRPADQATPKTRLLAAYTDYVTINRCYRSRLNMPDAYVSAQQLSEARSDVAAIEGAIITQEPGLNKEQLWGWANDNEPERNLAKLSIATGEYTESAKMYCLGTRLALKYQRSALTGKTREPLKKDF